jgi:glycosyltransferase involved in cell wall biosynthesis
VVRVAVDATPLLGRPTGVGVFCAGILGALGARVDLEVGAYAVSWRRRAGITALVPPGVRVRQRAMPARPLHAAWRHLDHPVAERFVGPSDVVHGTNFVVPPTGRAAAVVTVHDLTPLRYPELCDPATLRFPDLVRRALRRGAWVHTHSDYVAAEVAEAFGIDPGRVRAVAPGVPAAGPAVDRAVAPAVDRAVAPAVDPATGQSATGRPTPGRGGGSEAGEPGGGPRSPVLPAGTGRYVLAVGTAEPRKDLPGLVGAFDEVAAGRPDVALVLAGPDGWGTAALEEAIGAAHHARRIVRTGWLGDTALDALVRGATVLAYPSRYEGFGLPPLQAMAAGVPVVATRAGSIPEALGDAAVLVGVGDREGLAAAIAAVLDDDEHRQDLVGRGYSRARRYTWERCADGLDLLYRAALAERAAGPGRWPNRRGDR